MRIAKPYCIENKFFIKIFIRLSLLHTRLTPLGRIYIISIGAGFLPTRMQYQLKHRFKRYKLVQSCDHDSFETFFSKFIILMFSYCKNYFA